MSAMGREAWMRRARAAATACFACSSALAQGASDTRHEYKLVDLPPAWVVVLVVLPLLALVAWIGYARAPLSLRRRVVLALLRASSLALFLAWMRWLRPSAGKNPAPLPDLSRESGRS